MIATRAMYPHYFLPLVPPLLLLGAVAVVHALDFGARRATGYAAFVLAATLCPVAFGFAAVTHVMESEDRAALLGAEMRRARPGFGRATRRSRSIAA